MKNLDREISLDYIRASGPGGQNVNKVSSAVQLRFDVMRSHSLSADVKARLIKIGGKRLTSDGVLIIEARRHRTQEQNREDALQRFYELMKRASVKPKPRHRTKPTKASKEERLKFKKRRGEIKKMRREKRELFE